LWYDEVKYVQNGGGETGHWSQVVWGITVKIGCGGCTDTQRMGQGQTAFWCDYYPPGNYIGQEPYNLGPTAGSACAANGRFNNNGLCSLEGI